MPQRHHLPRSLTARYVVALALNALLATVAFFVLDDVISRQRDEAAIVNVAGRQRMLSQKIGFLAARLISAPAAETREMRERLRRDILAAADLMEASHRILVYGDPTVGAGAATSPAVRQFYDLPPHSVSRRVAAHVEAARVVASTGSDAVQKRRAYHVIVASTPEFLVALDDVVSQYETESQAMVGLLARLEAAAWLATLAVLGLEAAFIFRPMMRTIQRSITAEESRRAAAEDQARGGERRNATLLDTIADAVVTTDSAGAVQDLSRAAEALFAYRREDVLGKPVEILVPDTFRALAPSPAGRPPRQALETIGRRSDGSCFPVELALGRWESCGNVQFTAVIRDITERRKAEAAIRQAQKMEVVGQLAGGVAHDFNNLLGIVSGNLTILAALAESHPLAAERIVIAQRAASRGADLTQKLLMFACRKPGRPEPANVNELIATSRDFLDRLDADHVIVVLELAARLPPVLIDAGDFSDCLLNIALNARDAMPDGGRLTITTRSEEEAVLVSVTDTGIGIPAEVLPHVFEPFFTTKDVGKGTGLGLSMVYAFAKRSGGSVAVASVQGEGTSVTLRLPI